MKKIFDLLLKKYLDLYLSNYLEKHLPTQRLVYGDESRLTIAKTAIVNNALFNLSSGKITIDEFVFFGHNVVVLTGTHDYYKIDKERQTSVPRTGRDVLIKQGAWIASNVTIIAPCTIGEHSVVAAGALVNKDVPPYTIVAGLPADIIKEIYPHEVDDLRSLSI